ncbi:MAG: hypothetical protein ACM3ZE_14890 [Myxococcales bacterium]
MSSRPAKAHTILVSSGRMRHDRRVPKTEQIVARPSIGSWHGRSAAVMGLAVCLAFNGCETQGAPAIHVNLGQKPEEQRSFQPRASLAEYTEIPGVGTELRVVLSSHPVTCDSYLPLAADQVLVTLSFSAQSPAKLAPGPYPWPGLRSEAEVAGAEPIPFQVMPYVRVGKQGREVPAGGLVELTDVQLDAQGAVRGVLKLEQPGAAGLPATSLLGSFAARWCRISTLSANEVR